MEHTGLQARGCSAVVANSSGREVQARGTGGRMAVCATARVVHVGLPPLAFRAERARDAGGARLQIWPHKAARLRWLRYVFNVCWQLDQFSDSNRKNLMYVVYVTCRNLFVVIWNQHLHRSGDDAVTHAESLIPHVLLPRREHQGKHQRQSGATLSKGLNRGLGTLTAAGLALAVAELSTHTGKFNRVVLIISTFVVAFCATLTKLHPKMKPYEYGLRVFLLTFCYVTVSGYNTGKFTDTAISRFLLIAIGAAVSLAVNIGIHPIWAGEDLHNLVAKNFAGVAKSLEGCVDGYLKCMEYEKIPSKILTYQASDDPLYSGYRAAVEASAQEETLLGFAVWEPPHGPYKMMRYPWRSYTKVGGALRHCSFSVMALHGCILSEIQAPPESRKVFSAELHRVGKEGAKVLRELGQKVETMTKLSSSNILSEVHLAAEELQKKIDHKSYLLVNTERWQATRRHGGITEGELPEHTGINLGKVHKSNSFASNSSLARFQQQSPWPVRQPLHPSLPFEVGESRTYESASALSLATFASLLIEFVARLQNLVDAFEELGQMANFNDPAEEPSAVSRESGGVLGRIRNFFRLKS